MRELGDQVVINSVLHWAQDDDRPCVVNCRDSKGTVSVLPLHSPFYLPVCPGHRGPEAAATQARAPTAIRCPSTHKDIKDHLEY